MKKAVVVLLIFYCFMGFGCFPKEQQKAPVMSQTQDIHGFIRIEGGFFTMGSPKEEPGRRHKGEEDLFNIAIDSFYISQYEVTQKEYYSIMKKEVPSIENEKLPVDNVSWFDAIEFCNKLSELHGLEPAYTIFYDKIIYSHFIYKEEPVYWNKEANGYRLPTSAEWECAIRAGTKTPFYTGETITVGQANFNPSYLFSLEGKLIPIGSYAPNLWNLYDMAGNVYEWCWDWHPATTGLAKVKRGGDYNGPKEDLRSANQAWASPYINEFGFRIARSVNN